MRLRDRPSLFYWILVGVVFLAFIAQPKSAELAGAGLILVTTPWSVLFILIFEGLDIRIQNNWMNLVVILVSAALNAALIERIARRKR